MLLFITVTFFVNFSESKKFIVFLMFYSLFIFLSNHFYNVWLSGSDVSDGNFFIFCTELRYFIYLSCFLNGCLLSTSVDRFISAAWSGTQERSFHDNLDRLVVVQILLLSSCCVLGKNFTTLFFG